MAISHPATRTAMAAYFATYLPWGALFTADPGTTGTATGECTGGSPAYTRKSNAWGTASAGAVTTTSAPVFDIAAGQTVNYFGGCTSSTPGAATVGAIVAVTSQAFVSQGTYTVTPTYTQS